MVACLDDEQRAEFEEHGWFTARGRERTYRITKGRAQNVQEVDEDGSVVARWCVHPRERVPDYDTMLAQKLMIELDEERFEEVANRYGVGVLL